MQPRDRLIAALQERANPRRRLPIDLVWEAFRSSVRGFTGDAEARPHLAALLTELEEQGALSQPKTRERWDRSSAPPLPHWIELAATPAESGGPLPGDHRKLAWPAPMVFVSGLRTVSNLDELLAIRAFLASGGANRPIVPLRERSVELFGDEKRLDSLVKGSLFGPGRLTLALLRCHSVAPPLTFEAVANSTSTAVLILENLHTYDSFRRYNRQTLAYRAIAYGHGSEFHATVADVPRLRVEIDVDVVEYFGDLDPRGLAIALAADKWLNDRGMKLEPATRWYLDLLDCAEKARIPGPKIVLEELSLAWLPFALRERTRSLLATGYRAPQELVGWERLEELIRRA